MYAQIVVDAYHWSTHPDVVEAVVGDARLHRKFLEATGQTAADAPLLKLSLSDWQEPFSLA